jgi:RNA polymerase sigma factor (sigma-70 family)
VASLGVSESDLEAAYSRWGDELVGYASALVGQAEAGDVVAGVFADLLGRPLSWWGGVHEPRAYLFRCVLNASRMAHRSGSRREVREAVAARLSPTSSQDPVALVSDGRVVEAVASLSVRQRAVIYHTYWEDLTPTQTAELLGVSVGSVKRQLARARARLRKVLT